MLKQSRPQAAATTPAVPKPPQQRTIKVPIGAIVKSRIFTRSDPDTADFAASVQTI